MSNVCVPGKACPSITSCVLFPFKASLAIIASNDWHPFSFFLFFFCLSAFSRSTPTAYGGSQARGLIGDVAAGLRQSHSNAGSLTHWARPGIKPETSWFLVGFVNHWATTGTPTSFFSSRHFSYTCYTKRLWCVCIWLTIEVRWTLVISTMPHNY